jgi:hypothetical protein
MAKDYYNDDDLPFPTLKQIEEATGLGTYRTREGRTPAKVPVDIWLS